MTTMDVVEYLTSLVGGKLNRDEGLHFGKPDQNIERIVLCWMADTSAIKYAAEKNTDLIITHESLFYPYDIIINGGQGDFLSWKVNRKRVSALSAAGLSVIRFHASLDAYCIFDTFASQLGLGEPVVSRGRYEKVFEIKPLSYAALIQEVKQAVDMPLVRVSDGNPERIIRKVGLAWGGMGLFVNVAHMQSLANLGCEVFIGGETDNYAIRFALESDMDIIETSHEVSENKGLRQFAATLRRDLPGINIDFFENPIPWRIT